MLFNPDKARQFASGLTKKNILLGVLAYQIMANWDMKHFPSYVLNLVMKNNQCWQKSWRSVYKTAMLGQLAQNCYRGSLHAGLEPVQRDFYSKALRLLQNAKGQQVKAQLEWLKDHEAETVSEVETGTALIPWEPQPEALPYTPQWYMELELESKKYEKDVIDLRELALKQLSGNLEGLDGLANLPAIIEQLLELDNPLGHYLRVVDYWAKHHKITPEILYNHFLPSAVRLFPSFLLALEMGDKTSVFFIERLRGLHKAVRTEDSFRMISEYWTVHPQAVFKNLPFSVLENIDRLNQSPEVILEDDTVDDDPVLQAWAILTVLQQRIDQSGEDSDSESEQPDSSALDASELLQRLLEHIRKMGSWQGNVFLEHLDRSKSETDAASFFVACEAEGSLDNCRDRIIALAEMLTLSDQHAQLREQALKTLLDTVGKFTSSTLEFGRELAWLPIVHNRYPLLFMIGEELVRRNWFAAASELYQGANGWYWDQESEEYGIMLLNHISVLILDHKNQGDQLMQAIERYCGYLIRRTVSSLNTREEVLQKMEGMVLLYRQQLPEEISSVLVERIGEYARELMR